ncbi:MAG: hypothetical protein HWQ35_16730 [Nostoc sp. NMS1]|uniref:hypothetical protein n=1 Tax=Nostoc sp. NMS1 TaxID=2815388 RepID=UPI0025D5D5D2|nr:hypothetical protein [Nostoc sp. NMS1]MBN3908126.1 hypothetical protein [Nostoc sp. NMS1]
MEPNLVTDPKILNVLNELIQREPIFHRPELGRTRADFEQMTESTFWEVGASGRRYSRQYTATLTTLAQSIAHLLQERWHCFAYGWRSAAASRVGW